MSLTNVLVQIRPSATLHLLPMLFVLGVDDNGLAFAFQNQVRHQRLLRSEVGRIPIEWRHRLTLPTSSQYSPDFSRDSGQDSFRPPLKKLVHRHRPRKTFEIAEPCQTAILCCPFD